MATITVTVWGKSMAIYVSLEGFSLIFLGSTQEFLVINLIHQYPVNNVLIKY